MEAGQTLAGIQAWQGALDEKSGGASYGMSFQLMDKNSDRCIDLMEFKTTDLPVEVFEMVANGDECVIYEEYLTYFTVDQESGSGTGSGTSIDPSLKELHQST